MNRYLSGGIGVAAALTFVFGSGVAGANNEYAGITYAKAQEAIQARGGGSIVITSREGSYLPTEQCMITGSRRSNFLDSSGRKSGYTVLVDLNCNDAYAGSGHPGNSAVTPEGKKQLAKKTQAVRLSKAYAYLVDKGQVADFYCNEHMDRCKQLCEEAKACSAELQEYLGM